jgi:HD-GYP domain-containing protein (c-di-GMP phosphodiesterase class II)
MHHGSIGVAGRLIAPPPLHISSWTDYNPSQRARVGLTVDSGDEPPDPVNVWSVGQEDGMSDIPLKTRIYTSLLALVTAAVIGGAALADDQWYSRDDLLTALLLAVMIVLVEKFEIDFPHSTFQFSITVGAILAFASGLTLGPVLGALVVIVAELVSDTWDRLQPIQILVNATNLGLATFLGAQVYEWLAGGATTPLDSAQAMFATVVGALVYTMVNTWVLAVIIAPVVGDSPLNMWKANFSATYIFLVLPTLGSLVPVIADVNPFGIPILVIPLISSHLAQRALRQVAEESQAAIEGLADALEKRDPYTHRHSIRVAEYTRATLEEMPHVPALTRETIISAARIHDLGKVGTGDIALRKNGPLTDQERQEMQQHAAIGADIIARLSFYKHSVPTVRHHHERWDGKGYPDKLQGENIPLGARIVCVADSFDAMTSDRPYRRAMAIEDALSELRRNSGTQFDPQIVDAFERSMVSRGPDVGAAADASPRATMDDERPPLAAVFRWIPRPFSRRPVRQASVDS